MSPCAFSPCYLFTHKQGRQNMNFNNIAQPWTTSPRQTPRLPVKGNDSFFWMHHPKNWELWVFKTEQTTKKKKGEELVTVNTPLWIPKLTKLIEQPGVNNITNEGSMVNSSYAQSIFIDRGFTCLLYTSPSPRDAS